MKKNKNDFEKVLLDFENFRNSESEIYVDPIIMRDYKARSNFLLRLQINARKISSNVEIRAILFGLAIGTAYTIFMLGTV